MRHIHAQWSSCKMRCHVQILGPSHKYPNRAGQLSIETADGSFKIPLAPSILESIAADMRNPDFIYKPVSSESIEP